jgi:hypothetical protein
VARILATGSLSGPEPEARCASSVVTMPAPSRSPICGSAPGASDVRLFTSPHCDATVDATSAEFGVVPYGVTDHR